ncbi:MAG TPA: PAS domain-containing protein, partial [Vicinamibacteria bacterium]|nr:PAS domain-containing protein [Vicinamibacteria bacterium]
MAGHQGRRRRTRRPGAATPRRVSRRLRPADDAFLSLADAAPALLFTTDAQGAWTFVNQCWCDFTGRPREQGLGTAWLDAVHPEDRGRAHEVFLASNGGRDSFTVDYRLQAHDGTWRWVAASGRPRFGPGGEFLGYVGMVLDITERKKADAARRRTEQTARFVSTAGM